MKLWAAEFKYDNTSTEVDQLNEIAEKRSGLKNKRNHLSPGQ